jgi:Trypsin-co-occurring domain 2
MGIIFNIEAINSIDRGVHYMTDETNPDIGLSELIDKVRQDLLAVTPGKERETPILFVESVELELKVTVKREKKAGFKVSVLPFSGELSGGNSRDDVHTVKVTLSPLFDKAQLLEWYGDLRPNEVVPIVKQSLDGLFKGHDENPSDLYG